MTVLRAVEQLRLQCGEWGIELDAAQLSSLSAFAHLLADYDLANVIGTRDLSNILLDHLVDALSCLQVPDLRKETSLIDVGTGAGLPGIPLSIARPDLRVALLEASGKKSCFLHYVQAELAQRNLEVVRARAEEAGNQPQCRGTFALATARALAPLPVVLEYCTPFVHVGGAIIAMKGRLSEEELCGGVRASHQLGVELREVRQVKHSVELPQKERRLAIFDKVADTPAKFPRRAGLAKKRPLGLK